MPLLDRVITAVRCMCVNNVLSTLVDDFGDAMGKLLGLISMLMLMLIPMPILISLTNTCISLVAFIVNALAVKVVGMGMTNADGLGLKKMTVKMYTKHFIAYGQKQRVQHGQSSYLDLSYLMIRKGVNSLIYDVVYRKFQKNERNIYKYASSGRKTVVVC